MRRVSFPVANKARFPALRALVMRPTKNYVPLEPAGRLYGRRLRKWPSAKYTSRSSCRPMAAAS